MFIVWEESEKFVLEEDDLEGSWGLTVLGRARLKTILFKSILPEGEMFTSPGIKSNTYQSSKH